MLVHAVHIRLSIKVVILNIPQPKFFFCHITWIFNHIQITIRQKWYFMIKIKKKFLDIVLIEMVLFNIIIRLTRQFIIQVTVFIIVLTCRCNRVLWYHGFTNCARHILNRTSLNMICLLFTFTSISHNHYTDFKLSKNSMWLRTSSQVLKW